VGWRAVLVRGLGLKQRQPPRLSVVLASAGVLVIAALVALNFLANRPGIGGPPTSSPSPSPFGERFGNWSRISIEPPHVHALTAGGPGLVAVGAYDAFDELADIWTSYDGRTWSRVPGEELGPGVIDDVAAGGPGLVAVGLSRSHLVGAVWTSRDGLTWTLAPDDPVFDGARIRGVAAGGPGLVAVGVLHRAWFSSDGLTWDLASVPVVPPDVYLGDNGQMPQVNMSDVAAAGDRLVAVGSMMMNDNSDEAVVWTSADGLTWTDVPLDGKVFPLGSSVQEVTGGPEGFIAIGEDARTAAAMWASEDGLSWRRVGSDNDPFRSSLPEPDGSGVSLSEVTTGNGGYVAVGTGHAPCNGVSGCSIEAAIWTSQDGSSWLRVPAGPVFVASDPSPSEATGATHVVSFGSEFVVLGSFEGSGVVWISEPPSQ
jgi:hypothetical protein